MTKFMVNSLRYSNNTETQRELHEYCVRNLEYFAGQIEDSFHSKSITGDHRSDGHDRFRFLITQNDSVRNGGIPGKLMNLQATVWEDINGNRRLDNNELHATLNTKVAQ